MPDVLFCHLCEREISFASHGLSAMHVSECPDCGLRISFVRIGSERRFLIDPWVKVSVKRGRITCPYCKTFIDPLSKFFRHDLKCGRCSSVLAFTQGENDGE